jgi:hypothetical protein
LVDFVREARAVRPDALLVGHADRKSFPALSGAALDKRITKPWQVSDFVDACQDRGRRLALIALVLHRIGKSPSEIV